MTFSWIYSFSPSCSFIQFELPKAVERDKKNETGKWYLFLNLEKLPTEIHVYKMLFTCISSFSQNVFSKHYIDYGKRLTLKMLERLQDL